MTHRIYITAAFITLVFVCAAVFISSAAPIHQAAHTYAPLSHSDMVHSVHTRSLMGMTYLLTIRAVAEEAMMVLVGMGSLGVAGVLTARLRLV